MKTMLERLRDVQQRNLLPLIPPNQVSNPCSGISIADALSKFGHSEFRNGQEEAITEVINGSNGVVVVFPTGHGKSLIYQIPALVMDGVAIVVSPLISLMKDQVDKLQKIGVKAILINSTLSEKKARAAIASVVNGEVKVLYVAPERFENEEFNTAMHGVSVGLMAIDEAHCISRWGHDFRPSYTRISLAIARLKPKQIVALTATATKKVRDDICQSLGIPNAKVFIRGVYRPNLELAVVSGIGGERLDAMLALASDFKREGSGTGIIYVPTKVEAEKICGYFKNNGLDCQFYHAGLKPKERTDVQNKWSSEGGIVVATCAFGMGIDRPDVRFVFHSGLSASVEDWYQEIGRAGRDGKPSLCVSFWEYSRDYNTQMMFIDMTNPSGSVVRSFWEWLKGVALSRLVQGNSTVTINMTQNEMAYASGCRCVGGCMTFLRKKGVVSTIGKGAYRVSLGGNLDFDFSELDRRRQYNIDRLDTVVSFYQTKECRASFISDYFGDYTFVGPCGTCDVCNSNQKSG